MAGFFGFFDFAKEGPGVSENAPRKRDFFRFFDIFMRKFTKLVALNLLYILFSLPALFVYFLLSSMVAGNLFDPSIENYEVYVTIFSLTTSLMMMLVLGGGVATPGFTYVIKSWAKEEHSFLASDFWEHIVKNLKQSIIVFATDIFVCYIVFFNINVFIVMPGIFGNLTFMIQMVTLVFTLLYLLARMYLYTLMVTFKSSIWNIYRYSFVLGIYKLLPNALIFAITLGIFYLVTLLPDIPAFFAAALILYSATALIQMIYTYSVIEKTIDMGDGKKEEPERLFED